MSAYPSWTPAPRPGIVPLHPLTFGIILGRSFVALRQNPRVLLGFALVVQTLVYVVVTVAVLAVSFATLSRLETVPFGSPDFEALVAGSVLLIALTAIVLGLAAGAIGVIVQGVVVAEVAAEVVAEKLTLGALWRRVRPAAWRLVGWTVLLSTAVAIAIAIVVAVVATVAVGSPPLAVLLGVLVVLASIPLIVWLAIKLLLVPSVLILEGASIRTAVARSWRLIRGRFWVAFGVIALIVLIFGTVAQLLSLPLSFLGSAVAAILSPTGAPDVDVVVGILVGTVALQALVLVVQTVGLIVQSTATALVYVDCRMRHEGLDLDLLAYVDERESGHPEPADPYRRHVGRTIAPRPGVIGAGGIPTTAYPAASPPAGYGAPPAGYGPPPAGYTPPPAGYDPPSPMQPPPATSWTAPGAPTDDDRDPSR